jgi:excisionase family DNA binding protein
MSRQRDPGALLLDLETAAALLSISRSRCYALARAGELPGLLKLGSTWRVSRARLEQWISAQIETPAVEKSGVLQGGRRASVDLS